MPGRDFEQDRLLACEADRLLGYADIWLSPQSEAADIMIAVDPSYWRQGIGTMLLEAIKARATEIKARSLIAYADSAYAGAAPFLSHHGFKQKGVYRRLSHRALDTLPTAQFPRGLYTLSYDRVNEVEILRLALERGYGGLIGHKPPTVETCEHFVAEFGSENIYLLFNETDKVIGCTAIGFLEETTVLKGYMDAPGLEAHYRQADLYRAMALLGLSKLKQAGYSLVELMSWGDAEDTIRTYKGIGFSLEKEVPSFELVLVSSR